MRPVFNFPRSSQGLSSTVPSRQNPEGFARNPPIPSPNPCVPSPKACFGDLVCTFGLIRGSHQPERRTREHVDGRVGKLNFPRSCGDEVGEEPCSKLA